MRDFIHIQSQILGQFTHMRRLDQLRILRRHEQQRQLQQTTILIRLAHAVPGPIGRRDDRAKGFQKALLRDNGHDTRHTTRGRWNKVPIVPALVQDQPIVQQQGTAVLEFLIVRVTDRNAVQQILHRRRIGGCGK